MTDQNKARAIISFENLRLIESEIFNLTSRYGIKSLEDLDKLLEKGKLTEKEMGEDYFKLDYLLSQRKEIEQELKKLSVSKSLAWTSFQDLLKLPKRSFSTS